MNINKERVRNDFKRNTTVTAADIDNFTPEQLHFRDKFAQTQVELSHYEVDWNDDRFSHDAIFSITTQTGIDGTVDQQVLITGNTAGLVHGLVGAAIEDRNFFHVLVYAAKLAIEKSREVPE